MNQQRAPVEAAIGPHFERELSNRCEAIDDVTTEAAATTFQRQLTSAARMDNVDGPSGGRIAPTASKFGTSCWTLLHWKRSFFKLVWKQWIVYYLVYVTLTWIHRHVLDDQQKVNLEALALYVSKYGVSIPVVLLLGFFNSAAIKRWFSVVSCIPGTSGIITRFIVSLKDDLVDGESLVDEFSRYVLLNWVLMLRIVCRPLRRRYPTLVSLQDCGLLSSRERIHLERMEQRGEWTLLPLTVSNWLLVFIKDVERSRGFVRPTDCERHIDAVLALKKSGGDIIKFASHNIPVALVQSVTIAIYCFGFVSVLGHQFTEKNGGTRLVSGYLPFLYAMPYFLYYAWLKVGRIAADPFGEDEDDIDLVDLFHKHVADSLRLRHIYNRRFPLGLF